MSVETFGTIGGLNNAWPANSDLIAEGDDHIRGIKTTLKTVFPNFGTSILTATPAALNFMVGVTSAVQTQLDAKAPIAAPTFTGVVTLPATTSIGTVSDAELATLDGVTSPLQAQINAKAPIASPTFTGTPAAPTAAPGTNTTQVATTAYVVATALAATLPAQAGNANKIIRTNGTTAAWDYPRNPVTSHGAGAGVVVLGRNNKITSGSTALTLPALVAGDSFQITNGSNAGSASVDFAGYSINGRAVLPGVMTVDDLTFSKTFTYDGVTLLAE